ncbi:hypothetical protein A3C23_01865 [Candidatus Roizmanbacteria bacterium RIFCSPHIGHO2_02_FULL_37_13b]|uniref:Peptidase M23 domain-containing protein n=1 Tax=Candidatus Roizmanbacteria bacterium RIFCSPLOWO2_02_FULL_36_11 TaxID=1802071 RepID=A0A1F7JBL5_9BACT|nr:MAG: hypothetical protein A3C23_01865 [Candidatus Roizmanbacteria bacterium RIFCSPHIGHO2_02_FULL_37_13b]OGK52999.1 MAG: hypothetical protein A3H78_02185 [Candidatus Roizmanbacteria bacterium RIFCSPLOWO2_02_FULL_36_11]
MRTKNLLTIIFIFTLLLIFSYSTFAKECENQEDCQKKIQEYEQKLKDTRLQKNTLSSEIKLMDTQIQLTTLKITTTEHEINTTEQEIEKLGARIDTLNKSLDYLGKILIAKINESYKNRETNFFDILFSSGNATTLSHKIKYLKTAQDTDRRMAFKVQQNKDNFEEQKKLREQKKQELDTLKIKLNDQQIALGSQKQSKQKLLEVTKNDERTFQSLLDKLRAEYLAIQAIVSGGGSESKMRDVKQGEGIASVIGGASCNSSGQHLHFIVKDGDSVVNPFSFLKSVDYQNCSGPSCGSGDGDPFNPSGSWEWPLNPKIELEQGFGSTWGVRNTWVGRIYSFHNGIDINGSSQDVKAVSDGVLYRGAFSGSGGCTLPYVKLVHSGSNISTYYLHVYPR